MNRLISKLARLLPGATVAGMALFVPAHVFAQQEQPILFSSPNDDDIGTNMPSLAPRPPAVPDAALAVQAPSFNFNAAPNTAPAVMPPRFSPAQIIQMQEQADERDNWELLTPQELLGVSTPKKIMGLSDDENKSVTERYLERQDAPPTNGINALSQWDLSGGETNSAAAAVAVYGSASPVASSFFSQMMGVSATSQAQNQNVGNWSFNFGLGSSSATLPQPTPEQVADQEAFQKMITRSAPSPSSQTEPLFNNNPFNVQSSPVSPAVQPAQDTLLAAPRFNPMGGSYAPLRGGIQAPVTAKPLPGLVPQKQTSVAPEWKPQLPPWMSPVPQPGQIR